MSKKTSITKVSKEVRKALHKSAGIKDRYVPVEILPGIAIAPRIAGSKWHYVTPAGNLVQFPNAYRRAFGRPQYVHSTYRLQVGSAWIDSACASR
jgi:hypothetical protein